MVINDRIQEIEIALRDAKRPLRVLFAEAGVDRSTWTRWRSGTTSPRLKNWLSIEDAAKRIVDASTTEARP